MRIAVIGTGYLGATHAACMAQIGHDVLGVDIDPGKVAKLQSGEVPFFEPGIEDIVRDDLASGRLRFTDSYVEAADFALEVPGVRAAMMLPQRSWTQPQGEGS
jgi:UDPglucose 6-dehydrogenase